MGDPNKGTDTNCIENIESADWFIVHEADCIDDGINTLENIFEESNSDTDVSNLIDDDQVDQGNSLAFYNSQIADDCERALIDLKRKYIPSPVRSIADLSPRLDAVHISPQRQIKKRLFEDSGVVEDEAESTNENVQVEPPRDSRHTEIQSGGQIIELLKCSNFKALFLAKFKELFGVSYHDQYHCCFLQIYFLTHLSHHLHSQLHAQ